MAELGNLNRVYVKTSSGSGSPTYTAFTGESSNGLNFSASAVEVSDKSSPWQQFIAGLRGGTVDITLYANNSDAQQKAILDGFVDGEVIDFFIGQMNSSTPSKGVTFSALVTGISDTNENASVSSRNLSLQITGQPAFLPAA